MCNTNRLEHKASHLLRTSTKFEELEMDAELDLSPKRALGFAETTECRYIEFLKWSDVSTVERKEGVMDDHSLPRWLRNVFIMIYP